MVGFRFVADRILATAWLLLAAGSLLVLSAGCQNQPPAAGVGVSPAADVDAPVDANSQTSNAESVDSETMSEAANPLEQVSAQVRGELDLFTESTMLLQRVIVMQETKMQRKFGLNEGQIQSLAAVKKDVEALGAALKRLRPEERDEKLRGEFRPKSLEYSALVDAQLNESQRRELFREVVRRQQGAMVFLLPGVPEELELTADQKTKLYSIVEETRRSINFDNLYSPIELAKLLSRSNAARKAATALLTPEQLAKFQALIAS